MPTFILAHLDKIDRVTRLAAQDIMKMSARVCISPAIRCELPDKRVIGPPAARNNLHMRMTKPCVQAFLDCAVLWIGMLVCFSSTSSTILSGVECLSRSKSPPQCSLEISACPAKESLFSGLCNYQRYGPKDVDKPLTTSRSL